MHLKSVDLTQSLASKEIYEAALSDYQKQLSDLAVACYHNDERVVIVLEGWDAAGKGGCIRRIVDKLDPRSYSVYPIAAPNPIERQQHYLQRFWRRLPHKGHIAIFDRSWYGRVLVERIEQFATEEEWHRAFDEINSFERMLTDDGMVVVKLFLHISQGEQLRRYEERMSNPRKHWKLTEEDIRNRARADEYANAYEDMFKHCHTEFAPWHLIAAERKWFARVECMEAIVKIVSKNINVKLPVFSPEEVGDMRRQLGLN